MPIMNFFTHVPAKNTVGEILAILSDRQVTRLMIENRNGVPIAITFQLTVNDKPLLFRMPCRWERVYKVIQGYTGYKPSQRTEQRALDIAWRITKDWLDAQLAIIESEQVEFAEVFLPYAVTPTGQTMYEAIRDAGYLLEDKRR